MRRADWIEITAFLILRARSLLDDDQDVQFRNTLRLARACLAIIMQRRRSAIYAQPLLDFTTLAPSLFEKCFRFLPSDFEVLLDVINLSTYTTNGFNISARRRLQIVLFRLSYPKRLLDIGLLFGLSTSSVSLIFSSTVDEIDKQWGFLLHSGKSLPAEVVDMYVRVPLFITHMYCLLFKEDNSRYRIKNYIQAAYSFLY
jgi:hypothetical protein